MNDDNLKKQEESVAKQEQMKRSTVYLFLTFNFEKLPLEKLFYYLLLVNFELYVKATSLLTWNTTSYQ